MEALERLRDAIKYGPKGLQGFGPWRQGQTEDGQKHAVCPDCLRRYFGRGFSTLPEGFDWKQGADEGRHCAGGCDRWAEAKDDERLSLR